MVNTINICPNCGTKKYKKDTSCYECGFNFEKAEMDKEDRPVEQNISCPHCGKEIPEDDKDYNASAIKCRYCGELIESTNIFGSDWSRRESKPKYWQKNPSSLIGLVIGILFILMSVSMLFKMPNFIFPSLLTGATLIIRSFGPRPRFGRGIAIIFGGLLGGTVLIRLSNFPESIKVIDFAEIIISIILIWFGFKR